MNELKIFLGRGQVARLQLRSDVRSFPLDEREKIWLILASSRG